MEDKYIKTNIEGLVIDRQSKAILNTDNLKLTAYRKQKHFMAESAKQAKRIDNVETQLTEIKQMLGLLLEKISK